MKNVFKKSQNKSEVRIVSEQKPPKRDNKRKNYKGKKSPKSIKGNVPSNNNQSETLFNLRYATTTEADVTLLYDCNVFEQQHAEFMEYVESLHKLNYNRNISSLVSRLKNQLEKVQQEVIQLKEKNNALSEENLNLRHEIELQSSNKKKEMLISGSKDKHIKENEQLKDLVQSLTEKSDALENRVTLLQAEREENISTKEDSEIEARKLRLELDQIKYLTAKEKRETQAISRSLKAESTKLSEKVKVLEEYKLYSSKQMKSSETEIQGLQAEIYKLRRENSDQKRLQMSQKELIIRQKQDLDNANHSLAFYSEHKIRADSELNSAKEGDIEMKSKIKELENLTSQLQSSKTAQITEHEKEMSLAGATLESEKRKIFSLRKECDSLKSRLRQSEREYKMNKIELNEKLETKDTTIKELLQTLENYNKANIISKHVTHKNKELKFAQATDPTFEKQNKIDKANYIRQQIKEATKMHSSLSLPEV